MAMKEQPRSVYRSMQGKEIDMQKLVMQNELTVAVGNVKVNARGDELGPGGQIIRKREDVLRETSNTVSLRQKQEKATPAVEEKKTATQTRKTKEKNIQDMDPEGNE